MSTGSIASAGGAARRTTVPAAVRRHWRLTAAIAIVAAALGALLGQVQTGRYQSTARLVVEDPQRGTDVLSAAVSPDRYVHEQVAVFDLPALHELGATIHNAAIEANARVRSTAVTTIGADGAITLGSDGTIQLGAPGSELVRQPDGSIRTGATVGVFVDADGKIRRADRTQVLDASGAALSVQTGDVVVIRSDGLALLVGAGQRQLLLDANGDVIEDLDEASVPGLSRQPDGSLRVTYGRRQLSIAPDGSTMLLGLDGAAMARPDTQQPAGSSARLFLLDREGDGAAVALSGDGAVIVDSAGDVVVSDLAGQLLAQTSNTTAVTVAPAATSPVVHLRANEFRDNLFVTDRPNTNMVEITYVSADPEIARLGANAAAEAYRQLSASDSNGARSEALNRADRSLAAVTTELSDAEAALAAVLADRPGRAALTAQYDELVAQLAAAGRELLDNRATATATADRIKALQLQLDAIRVVGTTDLAQPDIAKLVEVRDRAKSRLATIQSQRDALLVDANKTSTGISLLSPAIEASASSGFGGPKLVVFALFGGLLLGSFVSYMLDSRLSAVDAAEDVGEVLGVPLLGEVPDYRHERIVGGVPVMTKPESFVAEAYRIVAATIVVNNLNTGSKMFGVVSAGVGEGKTSVVANLAVALAHGQRSVLATDADLEGQALSHIVGKLLDEPPSWSGISDILAGSSALDDSTDHVPIVGEGSLELLSGGSLLRRGRSLFDSTVAEDFFASLPEQFDTVLVDLPPLLNVAYAGSIVRQLDGVIVVVRRGAKRRDIEELSDRLQLIGRPVVGFIMTAMPLRPERTASIAALHYDLGNKTRSRRDRSKLKRRGKVRPA